MISVVMANFNGEKYIKEAIESVLDQDFDNYEFIIVDDGSTDNSREIISEFHKKYTATIHPIFQKKNYGQGVAFNIGLSLAKGDIISFIDSDDIWYPDKLKNVFSFLSNSQNISLLQHNLHLIRKDIITNEKVLDVLITGDYFSYSKKKNIKPFFVPTSGLSFPKPILDKVLPIPDNFKTSADSFITHTCFCYGEVVSVNQCWGAYRVHENNIVFENPKFNNLDFNNNLLFPLVNNYYKKSNIDFKFNTFGPIKRKLFVFIPPILFSIKKKIINKISILK